MFHFHNDPGGLNLTLFTSNDIPVRVSGRRLGPDYKLQDELNIRVSLSGAQYPNFPIRDSSSSIQSVTFITRYSSFVSRM